MSGNGMRRKQQGADGPKDRTQLLKYAIFYLVVAAIVFVSTQAAKNPMAGVNQSQSPPNLHINLSIARKLESNHLGSNKAGGGRYVVHFRLTNQGNQPIFCPLSPNTNRPMGHLVYRIAPGSDWRLLSEPELSPSGPARLNANSHSAWVEMPPGGWADGEYDDPGSPAGEHAYELDLKFAADGKVSPLLSHAYTVNAN
jgi:hypothetical protein